MHYRRMLIEEEAPEELGQTIRYNLSESAVSDRTVAELKVQIPPDLLLAYSEHRGSEHLRSLIADMDGVPSEHVLTTSGASMALFIVATALLSEKDHLIAMRPNYATNIETPRAIGCEISYLDVDLGGGGLDVSQLAKMMQPNTRLISLTCPNNPTGTGVTEVQLRSLAELCKDRGCYLLVDETYRHLTYGPRLCAASTLGEHAIGVSSMSKIFGVPGLRVGWIETGNRELQKTFLAAKEQIGICGSVIDEWIAEQILKQHDSILSATRQDARKRLELVSKWIKEEEMLEWAEPQGGVMGLVHIKEEPVGGVAAFYERLLTKYGTYIGPGRWFDLPDTYFRLGFGWPTWDDLEAGLGFISKALRDSEPEKTV